MSDIRIVPMSTWLFYTSHTVATPMDPAQSMAKLTEASLKLWALDGGVLAVRGPSDWFTDSNRKHMRGRVATLHAYLTGLRLTTEASP
jgi:hypothetical protein